jgi:hypothetical protein
MSINIQSSDDPSNARAQRLRYVLAGLTLMLSGRAMTLAFITRAGGSGAGDPPSGWLMPLVGDALIGVSALLVVYLVLSRRGGLGGWTSIVVWNALAIWDALSAFLIHLTVPWPSFFMLELFGASMFFLASAMHAACLVIALRPEVRENYFTLGVLDPVADSPR